MANLYFCQPHAKNQGMLRAVLTTEECKRVVGRGSAAYLGKEFPKLSGSKVGAGDFAVLSFAAGETKAGWRPGYYRLDANLADLNEVLRELSR